MCILHQLYLVPEKLCCRIQDHGKRPRDRDVVFHGSSLLSTVAHISGASHINKCGLWWSRQRAVPEWYSNARLQACAFWAGTAELSEVEAGLCLDISRLSLTVLLPLQWLTQHCTPRSLQLPALLPLSVHAFGNHFGSLFCLWLLLQMQNPWPSIMLLMEHTRLFIQS